MRAHLVGGGLASLAAAAYLIRDAGADGSDITIYEAQTQLGGALNTTGSAETGYSFPGSRIFEWQYRCAMDLFAMVPSASDPTKSIKQEIAEFNARNAWYNKARLVDRGGKIANSKDLGLGLRQKVQLLRLILTPEFALEGKQIKDCVSPDFFETTLWYVWSSMMAIVPEHSAIEIRRYFLRFFHLLPDISTMAMFLRTKYNQRQAIIEPVAKWLRSQGVKFVTDTFVCAITFKSTPGRLTASSLRFLESGKTTTVDVNDGDLVMVTNGSQVSDVCTGSMTSSPYRKTSATGASFTLWKSLAGDRKEFGRPEVFTGDVNHSTWISFTVTCQDQLFSNLMEKFSGREAGRGGLISFKQSNWLITIVTYHQPNTIGQPADTFVWWGYGIYPGKLGNFVKKPMVDCSGEEVLREVLMHLGFDDSLETIIKSSICIPCLLPFAGSVFTTRKKADRPAVVPKGSTNFAFIGQFCEQPGDVIFTMEYSVRSSWTGCTQAPQNGPKATPSL